MRWLSICLALFGVCRKTLLAKALKPEFLVRGAKSFKTIGWPLSALRCWFRRSSKRAKAPSLSCSHVRYMNRLWASWSHLGASAVIFWSSRKQGRVLTWNFRLMVLQLILNYWDMATRYRFYTLIKYLISSEYYPAPSLKTWTRIHPNAKAVRLLFLVI